MSGHVVLIGLMGSGKSTVGLLLANLLDRDFLDNDVALGSLTGRSARAIEQDAGRAVLHAVERDVLARALSADTAAVVAAAASVVDTAEGQRLLRDTAAVVWLRASPDLLATRLADRDHRPLPADQDLRALLTEMAARREALFTAVATIVVDAANPPDEIAARLVAELCSVK